MITYIITPTWNCGRAFWRCAQSVIKNTHTTDWAWVVVENGSTPEQRFLVISTVDWLRAFGDGVWHWGVYLLANDENLGIPRAQNQALEYIADKLNAPGNYRVLLLDADTEVCPSWLGKMVAFLDQNPEVGIVGAARAPGGGSHPVYHHTNGWWYVHDGQPQCFQEGESLDFAGVLWRPELLERGLRFDTGYETYDGYDQDLCFRVRSWGYKCVQTDAGIIHYGQVSWNHLRGGPWDDMRARNIKRFVSIWHPFLASRRLRWEEEPAHMQRMNAKLVAEAGDRKKVPEAS